jgi:acetyltransferase-like isoleucine patch superfamily enzyme
MPRPAGIIEFMRLHLPEKLNLLRGAACKIKGVLYYRHIFAGFGSGSKLFKPLLLSNPRFITVGRDVLIRQGARLEVIVNRSGLPPKLQIGNNVNIEQNVHIVCHSKITIGNDVSITGHCAIVDVTHPYVDVHDPIKIGGRILNEDSFVAIGDGSFLGFGAVVLPNVKVGKYCVIGALSVVTKDVPDYSVVAGNPAKLVRQYDSISEEWRSLSQPL